MEKILKYRCGTCREIFDEEFQADDCCVEMTETVAFYSCDECEEEYETEKEAFECCNQTTLNETVEVQS